MINLAFILHCPPTLVLPHKGGGGARSDSRALDYGIMQQPPLPARSKVGQGRREAEGMPPLQMLRGPSTTPAQASAPTRQAHPSTSLGVTPSQAERVRASLCGGFQAENLDRAGAEPYDTQSRGLGGSSSVVEPLLAMQMVEGSSPFSRSRNRIWEEHSTSSNLVGRKGRGCRIDGGNAASGARMRRKRDNGSD